MELRKQDLRIFYGFRPDLGEEAYGFFADFLRCKGEQAYGFFTDFDRIWEMKLTDLLRIFYGFCTGLRKQTHGFVPQTDGIGRGSLRVFYRFFMR